MQDCREIHIVKFLSGNATSEEVAELKAWIEDNEDNKKYFAELESVFNVTEILKNKNNFNALEAYSNFRKEKSFSLLHKLLPIAATFMAHLTF